MTIEDLNKQFHTSYAAFGGVDWLSISEHQSMSEDFIRESQDKIVFNVF